VGEGHFSLVQKTCESWEDREVQTLPDGRYEALVLEADIQHQSWHLAVVLTQGPLAGTVVDLPPLPDPPAADPLSLLGLPGILSVQGSSLRFTPDLPA
jgi:hypothetical protein